jgi:anaerobic magnesium-protoporphyrin IX monomethyl ester cyclase
VSVSPEASSTLLAPSRLAQRIAKARATVEPPVLLITPPSPFLLDERVFLSLGILKVAAVLEQAGRRVEVLDLSGIENFVEVAGLAALKTEAVAVGITATTPQLPAAVRIVKELRAKRPDVRLILGGPHATLVYAAVKLELKSKRNGRAHAAAAALEQLFDVIVAGDGELAVFDALAPDAPKVVDGDEPKQGLFMDNAVYAETPRPARHLADLDSYHYAIEGHRATTLIAQIGCPFACGFCGGRNSKMLRQIRTRGTMSIVDELEHLHRAHGFTGFMLYDDELNVNRSFVELLREIRALQDRLGVEFRLRGFVKSELFNEEQAEAMYAAGFRWILCGFEAASPRILENINKKATLEDNTRVVAIGHKYGLKTKALMSVGHAGESAGTILAVRDWLLDVKPADFDCTVITTYPGTPYYDEAVPGQIGDPRGDVYTYTCKKSGDRLHSFDVDYMTTADYYKGDPAGGYHSYVFTDYLQPEEIVRLRDQVEAEVRSALNIPFNPGKPGVRFEHSMGAGEGLPRFIFRKTVDTQGEAR